MKDTILLIIIIISIIAVIGLITVIIFNNNNGYRLNELAKKDTENFENIGHDKNEVDNNDIGNYLVSVSSAEEKLSPKAYLIFNTKYIECGHIIKKKERVSEENVNLTKEEIRNLYKDWELIDFSDNKAEFYKENPGECGEHYIIKEKDGHVVIYKINQNDEEILMDETDIEIQYLPETDKEDLIKGIKVYTEETLNAYLENFE